MQNSLKPMKKKKITDLLIDETLDEIVDKLLLELNDI